MNPPPQDPDRCLWRPHAPVPVLAEGRRWEVQKNGPMTPAEEEYCRVLARRLPIERWRLIPVEIPSDA